MAAQSRADVVWEGDLAHGQGRVKPASGAFPELPITWASRTQRAAGKTSPEELIAAAHAGCYAMSLSHTLAQRGTPPTRLDVSALSTFDTSGGGAKVTTIDLDVRGQVPGMDQETFTRVAQEAEKGCPVSNALRGNVDIRLKAQLEK